MKTLMRRWLVVGAVVALQLVATPSYGDEPRYDLSHEKVLYCVGYAHLDTQWRWDFCKTIDQFILDTLDQNSTGSRRTPAMSSTSRARSVTR